MIEELPLVGDNWIRHSNDLLKYYMGLEGEQLSDDEWIKKVAFLIDIRKKEAAATQPFKFKF